MRDVGYQNIYIVGIARRVPREKSSRESTTEKKMARHVKSFRTPLLGKYVNKNMLSILGCAITTPEASVASVCSLLPVSVFQSLPYALDYNRRIPGLNKEKPL